MECSETLAVPTFPNYLMCMEECETMSCAEECEESYPDAASVFAVFEACLYGYCVGECQQFECGLTTGDPLCDGCLSLSCGAPCEACTSDSDCIDWLVCAQNCMDQDCFDACTAQYPEGEELMTNLTQCLDVWCHDECYYY